MGRRQEGDAEEAIVAGVQAPRGSDGAVETTARPAASTATHSHADGQVIAFSRSWPSIDRMVQVGAAAVGFVEISAWPSGSIATQNAVEPQATPTSDTPGSMSSLRHVGRAAAGSVDTNPSLSEPTARHSAADGQDTASNGDWQCDGGRQGEWTVCWVQVGVAAGRDRSTGSLQAKPAARAAAGRLASSASAARTVRPAV